MELLTSLFSDDFNYTQTNDIKNKQQGINSMYTQGKNIKDFDINIAIA